LLRDTLMGVGLGAGMLIYSFIMYFIEPLRTLEIYKLFFSLGLFIFLLSLAFSIPSFIIYYRYVKTNAKISMQIIDTEKLLQKAEQLARKIISRKKS